MKRNTEVDLACACANAIEHCRMARHSLESLLPPVAATLALSHERLDEAAAGPCDELRRALALAEAALQILETAATTSRAVRDLLTQQLMDCEAA